MITLKSGCVAWSLDNTFTMMVYVLLGVWINIFTYFWYLVSVAEYRKMVEKLYKPPSAA